MEVFAHSHNPKVYKQTELQCPTGVTVEFRSYDNRCFDNSYYPAHISIGLIFPFELQTCATKSNNTIFSNMAVRSKFCLSFALNQSGSK